MKKFVCLIILSFSSLCFCTESFACGCRHIQVESDFSEDELGMLDPINSDDDVYPIIPMVIKNEKK